jgi:hypothetical protein
VLKSSFRDRTCRILAYMDIDPICESTCKTIYDTAVSIRMVIISAQLKTCTRMNPKKP